jgi:hypothetical protein
VSVLVATASLACSFASPYVPAVLFLTYTEVVIDGVVVETSPARTRWTSSVITKVLQGGATARPSRSAGWLFWLRRGALH